MLQDGPLPSRASMLMVKPSFRETNKNRFCMCNVKRFFTDSCLCRCCHKEKVVQVFVPIKSLDSLICNNGPFAFSRINSEVSEYLLQKVWDELFWKQTLQLVFQTREESDLSKLSELKVALMNTFRFNITMTTYQVIRLRAEGYSKVLIAILVCAVCIGCIVPLLVAYNQTKEPYLDVIATFFIIFAWVAVWHPADMLIFSRYSSRRRIAIYRKLLAAKVELCMLTDDDHKDHMHSFFVEDPAAEANDDSERV